jgi:putative inorganic carbon (HCO3(-)) transporter
LFFTDGDVIFSKAMIANAKKWIAYSFYFLLFSVPLVLYPYTSEIFEFNKMVLTYALTTLIVSLWLIRMIIEKRVIFKRTFLDIPLLIFLASQVISTLLSIDTRTSIFGYYSRFHGGLLSTIAYLLLYWACVSNMTKEKTVKAIYALFISSVLVSSYAVLEHFGIDKDIWVQDVQNRVFSTLGQPNWLAAWIVALTPITWAFALKEKSQKLKSRKFGPIIWTILSSLLFLTLIFTKSRSGFLGLAVAWAIFWLPTFYSNFKSEMKSPKFLKPFLIINSLLLAIVVVWGTPWTPDIGQVIQKGKVEVNLPELSTTNYKAPALETGGTESGKIREIVWKGAIDIWKAYPVFGSGVETFAYSYYQFRPTEHNLVSEWDYLYNKAHNEYLNFAATTGTFGLLSYLILIIASLVQIYKSSQNTDKQHHKYLKFDIWHLSLLAGFISILITNFFGFSVVPVALLFSLYPAFATTLRQESEKVKEQEIQTIASSQKFIIVSIFLFTLLLFYHIFRYWQTDIIYARGKGNNDAGNYVTARDYLTSAVERSPNEALYWDELSQASTYIAVSLAESEKSDLADQYAQSAFNESKRAIDLSPANVNLKRDSANNLIKLSVVDPKYLLEARGELEQAVGQAPTEAKLMFNLGVAYLRTGETDKAKETFQKTIELKANYRNAYYALGLMYVDEGDNKQAAEQFMYILDNISPNDQEVKRELEEIQ